MTQYKYSNYKTGEVIIIEWPGDILEADKIYEQQTGLKPVKCAFIGCELQIGSKINGE